MAAGSVIAQIPLGLLSDRMSRGLLIMILAFAGLIGALLIPIVSQHGFWPLVTLLVVWGGLTGGLYTVGLAFLAARFQGQELAGANAAFVMLYNVGLTLGPPISGIWHGSVRTLGAGHCLRDLLCRGSWQAACGLRSGRAEFAIDFPAAIRHPPANRWRVCDVAG